MVKKYVKLPIIIEAVLWDGSKQARKDMINFGLKNMLPDKIINEFYIDTLEGKMTVSLGDYIIKGIKNEYYPCKPDIFIMTYKEVQGRGNNG